MVSSQVEYGCCGLSEEDAIKLYGEDNIETYLFEFGSLEHQVHLWLRGTGREIMVRQDRYAKILSSVLEYH